MQLINDIFHYQDNNFVYVYVIARLTIDTLWRLSIILKESAIRKYIKLKLLTNLVFPIFFYGVETWTYKAEN